ncbi:hypothetical protein RHSP_41361 (plasmid) [Rhizobium freirei PRF 81]|uniref:Uncharacterized protein n=1 Tax=Rhizobium freirei PRF 81 TaxID=363754 RepID=N6UQ05_9HYPH|nr:hypothetical protein RHSP_41361 [Rhizobium freirei PRF 81]
MGQVGEGPEALAGLLGNAFLDEIVEVDGTALAIDGSESKALGDHRGAEIEPLSMDLTCADHQNSGRLRLSRGNQGDGRADRLQVADEGGEHGRGDGAAILMFARLVGVECAAQAGLHTIEPEALARLLPAVARQEGDAGLRNRKRSIGVVGQCRGGEQETRARQAQEATRITHSLFAFCPALDGQAIHSITGAGDAADSVAGAGDQIGADACSRAVLRSRSAAIEPGLHEVVELAALAAAELTGFEDRGLRNDSAGPVVADLLADHADETEAVGLRPLIVLIFLPGGDLGGGTGEKVGRRARPVGLQGTAVAELESPIAAGAVDGWRSATEATFALRHVRGIFGAVGGHPGGHQADG